MSVPDRATSVRRVLSVLEWTWMALAILFLPVTSLPVLAERIGGILVSPPTVIFLGIFLLVWLPVYVFRMKGSLPLEAVPLFFFVCFALIASCVAFFLPIPSYKGISFVTETASAIVTLAAGVICYLVFATWFRAPNRLRFAFLMLNLTGMVLLAWSLMQVAVIYFRGGEYPRFMLVIQHIFSMRTLDNQIFSHRVTGFSYEPSWLAHQLNVLYLPYWLAATVGNYSAFRRRIWRFSAENILLVIGFGIMLGSLSRIGLLSVFIIVAYLFLRFQIALVKWLRQRFVHRNKFFASRWSGLLVGLGLFSLYGLLTVGIVYALTKVDPRLARIFNLSRIPTTLFSLANNLAFAERLGYWSVGWAVFAHYPITGVGLGNAGFFFPQYLLSAGRGLPELLLVEFHYTFLPNIKSLWIRLLSETGMVGFSLFSAWLYVLWNAARMLNRQSEKMFRMAGWMGLFAILALIGEGFSIDSFALPYYWISLGLLTAASATARQQFASDALHDQERY